MIKPIIEPRHFEKEARRIRAQARAILTRWGLLPRFKRWRLAQDPDTGMIVLFGILNDRYIATHTSTPFSDYFDSRLLNDLSSEMQLQVVAFTSDGLRYAFVLSRGSLGKLPTYVDLPISDKGDPFVRVVYDDKSLSDIVQITPELPVTPVVDDQELVHQGVKAFLKVFDDIQVRDDAALEPLARESSDIVMIDKDEFNQRLAEHEANRWRHKRIKKLFENDTEEKR